MRYYSFLHKKRNYNSSLSSSITFEHNMTSTFLILMLLATFISNLFFNGLMLSIHFSYFNRISSTMASEDIKISAGMKFEECELFKQQFFGKLAVANIGVKTYLIKDIMLRTIKMQEEISQPLESFAALAEEKSEKDLLAMGTEEMSKYQTVLKFHATKVENYHKNMDRKTQFMLAEQAGLALLKASFASQFISTVNKFNSLPELWGFALGLFPHDQQFAKDIYHYSVDYNNLISSEESSKLHPAVLKATLLDFQVKLAHTPREKSDALVRDDFVLVLKRHSVYAALVQQITLNRGGDPLSGDSVDAKGNKFKGVATFTLAQLTEMFSELYDADTIQSGDVLAAYSGVKSKTSLKSSSSNTRGGKAKRLSKSTGSSAGPRICHYCATEGHICPKCPSLKADFASNTLHPYKGGPKEGEIPKLRSEAAVTDVAGNVGVVSGFSARPVVVNLSSSSPAVSVGLIDLDLVVSDSEGDEGDTSDVEEVPETIVYKDLFHRSQQFNRDMEKQHEATAKAVEAQRAAERASFEAERKVLLLKMEVLRTSCTPSVNNNTSSVASDTPDVSPVDDANIISSAADSKMGRSPITVTGSQSSAVVGRGINIDTTKSGSSLELVTTTPVNNGVTIWFLCRVFLAFLIVLLAFVTVFFILVGPSHAAQSYK